MYLRLLLIQTVLLAAAHHIGALGTNAASSTKIATDHYGLPVLTLLSAEIGRLMTLPPPLVQNPFYNWQQGTVTSSQVRQNHEAPLGIPGHDTATGTMYLRLLFVQLLDIEIRPPCQIAHNGGNTICFER
ncbi:hypothetical protein HPB47_019671 [Ixodes persulcatus]|uniref:Uncharacterized protein n=1 Tax=Ixodes persulcatus TaxID=34615 RepID=A0AC60QIF5_IXOPE|nr:hypothetical protein HPB47_019671 [Ixodes persulcatus]